MKTRPSKYIRLLSVLCWAAWSLGPRAVAKAPAELGIQLHAGLTITGAVGTVYSVEYITDLSQTNNASAWLCLEFLQLPASSYFWADKSAPANARRFYRAVDFAAPTNLVFVPPGTFRMGIPTNEVNQGEWPWSQVAVTVSRGFRMGKYEVTQGEFLAVMGSNPSFFNTNNGYGQNLNRPVDSVRWSDATNYCGQLTQRERAAGRLAAGRVYRLPTQAEWEYACRGWTSTRFSHGDDPDGVYLTNYAWHEDNSGGETHPVGQKWPNPWGLYDMHGNVSELCQDGFVSEYPEGIAIDPLGPPGPGLVTLVRGGSWSSDSYNCRSAARIYSQGADNANPDSGFRILLTTGEQ